MMRIGIEGQRLLRKKKGGMDVVALELIRNLQAIDTKNEYVIFVKDDEDRDCLKKTDNFRIVEVEGGNYLDWEQRKLPRAVKASGVDLLHCTSNTAPYFSPVPVVLTLHDIIFLEKLPIKGKGTAYQQLGKLYRQFLVPRIVQRCEKLITVSRQEKDRILSRFDLAEDKVQVVYNGIGDNFFPIEDKGLKEEVKKAYQLPERFVLFLGNQDPKKNMPGLLESFGQLVEQDPNARLVLTAISRPEIEAILAEQGRPDLINKITLPGYVSFEHLPVLYALATVYIYPSLREGFGLPILEAFACGTPVITSDTSSMPEVAGEAAVLVNPRSTEAMTLAMQQVLGDPSLRASLTERGFERVRDFSWAKMAKEVLEIYQEMLMPHQKNLSTRA